MSFIKAPYIIELLTPKKGQKEREEKLLDNFFERYERVKKAGCAISVPDNPMGQHRLSIIECLERRMSSVDSERFIMNLTTFHTKPELDEILERAESLGIHNILVVSGDGGPHLPRLDPQDVGGSYNVATSIDLIRYISSTHPKRFRIGAAFNPYKKKDFELKKMQQKIEYGASFVITQPILGRDEAVDALISLNIEVVIEAWMSNNIDLLYRSVGKKCDYRQEQYDPYDCVDTLHEAYPEWCMYLAMLSFADEWEERLPKLRSGN